MYIQSFSHLLAFYLSSYLPESVDVDPAYENLKNAAHTQQTTSSFCELSLNDDHEMTGIFTSDLINIKS